MSLSVTGSGSTEKPAQMSKGVAEVYNWIEKDAHINGYVNLGGTADKHIRPCLAMAR
ncbi:hypothetical protein MX111_02640 [Streptococcus uberis]|uniref:hypothetical protein n=1 Tax=Streptococcus uberis TaxID=1349 RepID=UPI0027DDB6D7|nr:hypothetical protein [Streptococcus uberis]MCK1238357.1 hypothetical protein [Streptococcus uberis]